MRATLLLIAAVVTQLATVATAQPFRDNFDDGSASDDSPVTWSDYPAPYNLGTFAVVDGDLVISPATSGPVLNAQNYREKDVVVADRLFHDVNVLARVRALTNQTSIVGIGLLDTHFTDGTEGVSVNSSLVFDGTRRYLTMNREIDQSFVQMGEVNTSVSHSAADVYLRFAISGNEARFSVWPDGQAEPLVPQLLRTLPSSFDDVEGRVVIWAGNAVTASPVAFRFVNAVPEPSSLSLGALATLGLVFQGRRMRSGQRSA